MLTTRILCLASFIASSYQFTRVSLCDSNRQRSAVTSSSLASTKEDTLTIRAATGDELPRCASFLAKSMYPSSIPAGQAKELTRLELNDLRDRYGPLVGKRKFPSVFLVAVEDEEFIGSVGLDCQYYDVGSKKFRPIKTNRELDTTKNVVVVLANLAVRRDQRNKGIAQKLLQSVEKLMKNDLVWGQQEIFLLVDSENIAAQRLYEKSGYELIFEDADATCIASGDYSLKTQDCINYCYRKSLVAPVVKKETSSPFAAISGLFNSMFNRK